MSWQVSIRKKKAADGDRLLGTVVFQRTWGRVFDDPDLYIEDQLLDSYGNFIIDVPFIPRWASLRDALRKVVADDEGRALIALIERVLDPADDYRNYEMTIG